MLSSWRLSELTNPMSATGHPHAQQAMRCNFSIVYNRPPRTASAFFEDELLKWGTTHNRTVYDCGHDRLLTTLRLPECLAITSAQWKNLTSKSISHKQEDNGTGSRAYRDDGCGLLSGRMVLSGRALATVRKTLPSSMMLTSTRFPPVRILSHFLEEFGLNESNLRQDDVQDELATYLRDSFSPWEMFNFHFGTHVGGSCPQSRTEGLKILGAVTRYGAVVDIGLPKESSAILEALGLFTLDNIELGDQHRKNVRRETLLLLRDDVAGLLRDKACVEMKLHRALQLRMASVYETLTGTQCFDSGKLEETSSCLRKAEEVVYGRTWDV